MFTVSSQACQSSSPTPSQATLFVGEARGPAHCGHRKGRCAVGRAAFDSRLEGRPFPQTAPGVPPHARPFYVVAFTASLPVGLACPAAPLRQHLQKGINKLRCNFRLHRHPGVFLLHFHGVVQLQ
jgi:hypothetical protein